MTITMVAVNEREEEEEEEEEKKNEGRRACVRCLNRKLASMKTEAGAGVGRPCADADGSILIDRRSKPRLSTMASTIMRKR